MAQFAARNAQVPAVRTLAAQMVMQQAEELSVMTLLLRRQR